MTAESPYFFLSYARGHFDTGNHPNKWTVKFYKDLCADIAELTGSATPGYMDDQRLKIGTQWPSELTRALATCRVLLPIFSPQYFNSEYCGKEWEIFDRRVVRHSWGGSRPAVIIPVLWTTMEIADLPEFVQHVQHNQADLPNHYLREGLYGIMKLGKYREAYKETVLCLARAIVDAAAAELAPLDESEQVPLDQIPNAFANVKPLEGSLDVRLTIAACDFSCRPTGHSKVFYGESPLGWKPYRLQIDKPIANLADGIIRGMGHRAELRELGAGETEPARPDIVLVDMWAAEVPRLKGELGRSNGSMGVVLTPLDQEDTESVEHRPRLEAAVDSLIGEALARPGSRRNVPHDKFAEVLVHAVNAAISRHLKSVKVAKKPPGQEKPSLKSFEPGGRTD